MQSASSRFYEFGPFRVDTAKRVLLREGEPVSLSPKAFDTLIVLVQHAGEVVEKPQLMDLLWPDSAVEEANLPLNISALRKALGETPNERGYITTIPGRGYRFAAEMPVLGGEETDLILERHQRARVLIREHDLSDDAHGDSGKNVLAAPSAVNRRKRVIFTLGALGLSAVAVVAIYLSTRAKAPGLNAPLESLAVFPLKPIDEASRDEILGQCIADALITRLSNLGLVIVRPGSVAGKQREGKQPADIGRELNVEAVLDWRIQRSGGKVRLTVQLVKVQDGSTIWGEPFDHKEADIFALEDAVSEWVASALIPRLTGEQKRTLAKHYTENTEAYDLYLKGRFFWGKKNADGMKKAIELFQGAIDKDPNYALAYSGLADCYRLANDAPQMEVLAKANYNALKAVEIDDSLAEGHVSLATIKFQYLDWLGADREYKRALELNPNYTYGHAIYAQYLSFCGRFDEAAVEIKRAREIEPLERLTFRVEAHSFYLQGQVDKAIEIYKTVLEMDPSFIPAQREIGLAYEQKGMYEEAIKELQLALTLKGNYGITTMQADIGHVYAVWGKRSKARQVLDKLKGQSPRVYVSPYDIAVIYAGLGEKDQALQWLYKAYEDRSFWLPRIKVDPRLEICRLDPRFPALLRAIGVE